MTASREVLAIFEDWPTCPAGLGFRFESDDDVDVLRDLYASTRADELARVDWPEPLKQAFVHQQFSAQREQYRQHYPGAGFLIVQREGAVIGRLYVHRTSREVRLMEVTLQPAWRGKGLGSALMARLIEWADERGLPVTLHVEPFNPAHRLYQRLGFNTVEIRGVYHFMRREADPTGNESLVFGDVQGSN